jgi:hypothetical protein
MGGCGAYIKKNALALLVVNKQVRASSRRQNFKLKINSKK